MKKMKIQQIALDEIAVISQNHRPVNAAQVDELAESLRENQIMLFPITIRRTESGYELVAGRHRLEAYKLLGRQTIPATVHELDKLDAELLRIDENLIRHELTVLEKGEHLVRRDEILTAKGLRAQRGGTGANQYTSRRPGKLPLHTTASIAQQMKISKSTAQTYKQIAKGLTPKTKKLIRNTPVADRQEDLQRLRKNPDLQEEAALKIHQKEATTAREALRQIHCERTAALGRARPRSGADYHLYEEEFQKVLLKEVDPESVDLILTDPPYARQHLPLYEELARYGKEVLKLNGSLIAMTGLFFQHEAESLMRKYLKPYWTIEWNYGGNNNPVKGKRVYQGHKPLLWFVKGTYTGEKHPDSFVHNGPEKEFDDWQQPVEVMELLIERYSKPGDLILDPFMGWGTTGIAAIRKGRRFIGIEKETERFNISKERIAEAEEELQQRYKLAA